jgi:hypothetical protein
MGKRPKTKSHAKPFATRANGVHKSHVTRMSDASSFDKICINCGRTDQVPGGPGLLKEKCPKPVGKGGMTLEEYNKKRQRAM